MSGLYPLLFSPIYKERVWGGRRLETLYWRALPKDKLIGESWEISDREGDESVIENGEFAGKTLRWLMENHKSELLGRTKDQNGRFPLLIKILDAQDVLSLQVHPPEHIAKQLGGEPKTEMWYVVNADPDAEILAGLKPGVTREDFLQKLNNGTIAECFHRIKVSAGDAIFIPSGRVHALGKGLVIFEIQQNSDTTYRVYDWGRVGLDGKPRELHINEAIESINFSDYEPDLIRSKYSRSHSFKVRYLVDDKLFRVDACIAKRGLSFYLKADLAQILGVIRGVMQIRYGDNIVELKAGRFCLIPASLQKVRCTAKTQVEFLHIQAF